MSTRPQETTSPTLLKMMVGRCWWDDHLSGALFDCRGCIRVGIIPFEEVSYFQEENAAWRTCTKHHKTFAIASEECTYRRPLPSCSWASKTTRQQKTASHEQRERERGDGSAGLCHQNAHRRATSIPVQPGAKIGVEALGDEWPDRGFDILSPVYVYWISANAWQLARVQNCPKTP